MNVNCVGVIRVPMRPVEEIYRLVWVAVANKQPIEAAYQGRLRLFCPHRLGRNREGRLGVLCYQYGGDSRSGLRPVGRRKTGVVSRWRNSAG